jgi:hypothetical protein
MSRMFGIVGVLVTCCVITGAAMQARSDFSGTWVEDESQRKSPYTAAPGAGGARALSGKETPIVITQSADAITIERNFIEHVRHVHHFDGREDTNRNGAQVHTTRTRWERGRLITEGMTFQSTSQGETYWKIREVRAKTPKGELAVETTRVDEHGEARTIYQVYRRKG